jgi:outer membrane protein OmpA-like peptidoglycan-associated protein
MGGRALSASVDETEDVARKDRQSGQGAHEQSPGTRLLDAMRTGDDAGVLAVCTEATFVSADNMGWSCRGREEIQDMLTRVRARFPGLTFESRTRHVGFGIVIDEARVQDTSEDEGQADQAQAAAEEPTPSKELAIPDPDVHPMWDEPVAEKRNVVAVWRENPFDTLTPTQLNMPVRVTVRHDDLQVHDVTLSFPAALLKRALGMPVDPPEISLSEVQSAFIAPVGAGLTSYELARPELTLVPPPAEPEVEAPEAAEPPRRRRRRLAPVLLLLLVALVAGGGWWFTQHQDGTATAGSPQPSPSVAVSAQPSASASASPSAQATSTEQPVVTHAQPSDAPTRKPNITLTSSDLAFAKNSAELSSTARSKIDLVAEQVKAAGLSGKIFVNGYTDNLGSARSGIVLSRQRATAVSEYLGSQLVGVPVTIVVVANGEKDPIASNRTEAGRERNRRVTITLPQS